MEWVEVKKNMVAGGVQGVLSTACGHPFDLIKARMQTGMYKNGLDCFVSTVKNEGITALYRGGLAPMLSHVLKRPIQYPVLNPWLST